MPTKYGIMSDVHSNRIGISKALEILVSQQIDRLVLNGDLGDYEHILEHLFQSVAETGIKSYAQPGSRETIGIFEGLIQSYGRRYNNLVFLVTPTMFDESDHDIVFLPGSFLHSGWARNSGYFLTESKWPSGKRKHGDYKKSFSRVADIHKLVRRPERTVVFCHDPCRTYDRENGPDSVYSEDLHMVINVGEKSLREAYIKAGVATIVSGHVHSASHKACDFDNRQVPQGIFVNGLVWNSGALEQGKTGILTVDGSKFKYENLNIN